MWLPLKCSCLTKLTVPCSCSWSTCTSACQRSSVAVPRYRCHASSIPCICQGLVPAGAVLKGTMVRRCQQLPHLLPCLAPLLWCMSRGC